MRPARPFARSICRPLVLLWACTALTGCLPSQQAPAKADLRATDTAGRVPAIVDAADRDDDATLAELVLALGDEDPAIRLFASRALRQRTGEDFGYRYYDPVDKRRAAIARWMSWLGNEAGQADQDTPTRLVMPPADETE